VPEAPAVEYEAVVDDYGAGDTSVVRITMQLRRITGSEVRPVEYYQHCMIKNTSATDRTLAKAAPAMGYSLHLLQ